jgi:hypothetical protein
LILAIHIKSPLFMLSGQAVNGLPKSLYSPA